MEQELVKLSEIARETGVSPQTVRRYYAKLPENKKHKCCNTFAVDVETKELIIQQILSKPQNRNNSVATVLRSDAPEVLKHYAAMLAEKDRRIEELTFELGKATATIEMLQLPPPEEKKQSRFAAAWAALKGNN